MKKYIHLSFAFIAILLYSCSSNGQTQTIKTDLSATEFSEKMKETPTALLLDVRTPGEYENGHLPNAKNYDWKGDLFGQQISNIDKTTPVFVYCLSGSRSAAAANKMRTEGFTEVYELQGGIMKWRSANLPETTEKVANNIGMNKTSFDALLDTNKIILVDFYAEWCAPCKKMKPYIEEIEKDMESTVKVIRVNVDENPILSQELKIDAIPVLQVYKAGNLSWSNTGFIEKSEVLKQLK